MTVAEPSVTHHRRRIRAELMTWLRLSHVDAENIVQRGLFDATSAEDIASSLKQLTSVLGEYLAELVSKTRPASLLLPLDRLPELRETLITAGFKSSDACNVIAMCMDLLNIPKPNLEDSLSALRKILPKDEARRYFIRKKPAVLLIPGATLRSKNAAMWCDDAEGFWTYLSGDSATYAPPRRPAPPRIAQPLAPVPVVKPIVSRPVRPSDPVIVELAAHGIRPDLAKRIALRFRHSFQDRSLTILRDFFTFGWSGDELTSLALQERSRVWRKNPHQMFDAERALLRSGFDVAGARRVMTRHERFCEPPFEPILTAAAVFKRLGMGDHLVTIAMTAPKSFLMDPELIRDWHKDVLGTRIEPIRLIESLPRHVPHPGFDRNGALKTPAPPAEPETPTALGTPLALTLRSPYDMSKIRIESVEPIVIPPPMLLKKPREVAQDAEHELQWSELVEQLFLSDPRDKHGHLIPNRVAALTEDAWEALKSSVAWMWDLSGTAPAVADLLLTWMGQSSLPGEHSSAFRFMRRVVTEPELQPILRLAPRVIHHRMCVLRKTIGCDFGQAPELLLLAWESFEVNEIKQRVFMLDELGLCAAEKPYVNMLLEPSRVALVARLRRYLESKGG